MSVEIESEPLCYNFEKNNLLVLYCKFNVRELLVIFIKYLVALNFSCCCCLRVISDMDEPQGRLMGAHGYCTQVRFSMQYLYTKIFSFTGINLTTTTRMMMMMISPTLILMEWIVFVGYAFACLFILIECSIL